MNWYASSRTDEFAMPQPFLKRFVHVALLAAFVYATAAQSPQAAPKQEPQKTASKRAGYALLVGCTKYDHRPRIPTLIGPANDVELMRHVLEDSYGFDAKNVVTLSEAVAVDKGQAYRPVRKNIERAIRELVSKAKAGDEVVILLSGHGSQQPDDDDPNKADELDGLDEIFLPADIGEADSAGRIPNALIDDELGTWTSEIAAKGARVFLVADCCHSGTLLRGDVEVSREVPAEQLSSAQAIQAAQERAKKNPPKLVNEQTAMDRSRQGVVALYAAKAEETAPERPMPYGDAGAKRYGVLTFTLCKLLVEQAVEKGGTPLTFRELGQRIQAQYIAWGRLNGPTPFVDAAPGDIDREILGNIVHVGRSRIVLSGNPTDGWTINVGRLHGMTKDSVLAVYSVLESARTAKPLGHVVVTESRVTDSTVAPVAFGGLPEPTALPKRGVCNLVKLDYGELRIPVALDKGGPGTSAAQAGTLSPAQRDRLEKLDAALKEEAKQREALFRVVPKLAEAKWVVHFRGKKLFLLPVDAAQFPESKALPSGTPWLPIADDLAAKELATLLAPIARAQNLISVAQSTRHDSSAVASQTDTDSDAPRIQVELVKCSGKNDKVGELVLLKGSELALRPGDWIAFRVTNVGRGPVDFTLLFVDSHFGIAPIYPTRFGVSNRLEGSGNPQARPFQTRAYRVNGNTLGHEHLVAIAVPSTSPDEHVDFTFLAQSEVGAQQRSADPNAARSFDSPIGRLLRHAMFADGGKRGLDDHEASQHDAQLLSWDVVK